MNNNCNSATKSFTDVIRLVCIIGISMGLIIEIVNNVTTNQVLLRPLRQNNKENCTRKPKYWVYPIGMDNKFETLQHLHSVLRRIGYEKSTNQTPWDLLWTVGGIAKLQKIISCLKPHQKVNYFPGSDFITKKVLLSTSNSKYIPKAFSLPKSTAIFLKYAKINKKSLFLEKSINHRGISLKNVSAIDFTSGEKFIQEYVQNPFLVDGHKFDIGVYVVIMSANPLRVYWYKGDVGFRYCPLKYHPFDPKVLDKYVVRHNYVPTWELPSLAQSYSSLGHGMKDSFDIYVKSKGKDPSIMWDHIQRAIVDIFLIKQHHLVAALRSHRSQNNFFQMIRFDLIVDENLNVYLIEANLSPNLSSAYLSSNRLLFEQILYSLFLITGISPQTETSASSIKHIEVFGKQCRLICRNSCTALELCGLCKSCRSKMLENSLLKAYSEHLHRGDFRRLFPSAMYPIENLEMLIYLIPNNLSPLDRLHYMWYQGKCNQDITWCT